jgi:hypothetical protein
MQIGKLKFKSHAAKKPIAISPTGKFVKTSELSDTPSLAVGSLHALGEDDKVRLAVARYKLEPNFKLALVGAGLMSRDEIIEHMQKRTDFGQLAVNVEMDYCNQLAATLASGAVPKWPIIPKGPLPLPPHWKVVKKCVTVSVPNTALFCENTTDGVTKSFAQYRIKKVHPVFAARGFKVVALTGTDDTRAKFVPIAKGAGTVYLSGIGHGSADRYTGHGNIPILQVGHYDAAEVKGKATHFLSCQTALQLGPDAVKQGSLAYAGYDVNFTFVWDNSSTPIDEVRLFMESDSTFDIAMANGATAKLAYELTYKAFTAAMALVPGTAAAAWLKYDRDHLRLLGKSATTIAPSRKLKICFPFSATAEASLAMAGVAVSE